MVNLTTGTRCVRWYRHLFLPVIVAGLMAYPAVAQEGSVLTSLQNQIGAAAKGWETTVMNAARSIFWTLAAIEIGIAAIWLALQSGGIDSWAATLVRRIMFVGFFAFVLEQGPTVAKAMVDSLFQLGASGGTASPADVFNAGLLVASKMSEKIKFGLFEDNALALSASLAMIVSLVAFSLVAAIFISVMVEMYVGLLAGMIMLGLGGSSYTKDFAIRYLVYAFSVGMKLMALVMISRIGSEVLIGLANDTTVGDQFQASLAIAGIAVVVFIIAIYVPNIMQGIVQGVSVTGGMEAIHHGSQAGRFAIGGAVGVASLAVGGTRIGAAAYSNARSAGSSMAGAAAKGTFQGVAATAGAVGAAARDQAMGAPGSYGTSTLGLANAKLDQARPASRPATTPSDGAGK